LTVFQHFALKKRYVFFSMKLRFQHFNIGKDKKD